ncbi:MAG: DUF4827 domain-containing protein [Bacteroidaceae bacterium]|nr:DUF4827 domain-containing protein [Bacteroidaceae bacterium]
MKKLVICFVGMILACIAFNACSDNVTYAELLDDEKKAISNFIKDHNIKVITQKEFQDAGCVTDVTRNEFVQTTSGVYMQIIDKGSTNLGDTIRNNDMVLVRYAEYRLEKDSAEHLVMSNFDVSQISQVDIFRYQKSGTSASGIFSSGMMYYVYQNQTVPQGWLIPFNYVRDGARVKLIVPSKMGHETAMSSVKAYYYDIHKFQLFR